MPRHLEALRSLLAVRRMGLEDYQTQSAGRRQHHRTPSGCSFRIKYNKYCADQRWTLTSKNSSSSTLFPEKRWQKMIRSCLSRGRIGEAMRTLKLDFMLLMGWTTCSPAISSATTNVRVGYQNIETPHRNPRISAFSYSAVGRCVRSRPLKLKKSIALWSQCVTTTSVNHSRST